MTNRPDETELIRRFLLGDLDEERQDKIEKRLLTDKELHEKLSDVRDDLIDEYVFGILDGRDLELFEKNFPFTPDRLHQLRLSRAMRAFVETNVAETRVVDADPAPSWRRLLIFLGPKKVAAALAVGIVLSLGYGGWIVYRNKQLEEQVARISGQRLKVEQDLERLNKQPHGGGAGMGQASSIFTLTLKSRLVRDVGESRRAVMDNGPDTLQLRLQLDADKFPRYRAVVQTDDGADMYAINDLKAISTGEGEVVSLSLPSRLLPTGDYKISLSGYAEGGEPTAVGTYPFQIVLR
jgi:hypothetical protein